MTDSTPRIAAGLLGLALLWVGLYWWWPTSAAPRTVKAAGQAAVTPDKPSAASPPNPESNESPTRAEPHRPQTLPDPARDSIDARTEVPGAASPSSPSPPPAAKPVVIPPEFLEHTLAAGETFATLSLKYYGTAAYASSISKANPLVSPASLKPGRAIRVPKDPKNVQGLPVREPGRPPKGPTTTYTVLQGDSLSIISQRLYGEAKHARLIYEANRDTMKNEHSLRVGQKLVIPPKPAP